MIINEIQLIMKKIKYILPFFILIVIVSCHSPKYGLWNLKSEELKGRVKTISEIRPDYRQTSDSGFVHLYFNQSYNSTFKDVKTYDTRGDLIKDEEFLTNDSIRDSYRYEHIYDRKGNEIKCLKYSSGNLKGLYVMNYDNRGNISSFYEYSGTHDLIRGVILSYNKKRNLTERINLWSDSSIDRRIIYQYYKNDLKKISVYYGVDTVCNDFFLFNYNKKTNCRKEYHFEDDSLNYIIFKYYDRKGNIIKFECFKPDSTLISTSTQLYDKNGNMIEETEMNTDSGEEVYQYSYDKYGNWLSKTKKGSMMPDVVRKIEYY